MPSSEPMKTLPAEMAAEDLMGPPVLNCQLTERASGNSPGETPVRPGLPRNMGQASAVAEPSARAATQIAIAKAILSKNLTGENIVHEKPPRKKIVPTRIN